MVDRVGKLHVHELPHTKDLAIREDVYKCYCGTEFFVEENTDSGFSKSPKKWVELNSSSYSVEYEKTVNGEKFIGRADKDTVFDEPGGADDGSEPEGSGEEDSPSSDGTSGDSE